MNMNALLDTTNLDEMLAMLGDEFRDIVRQYVDQLEDEVAQLAALCAQRDWEALTRMAHTLKGSSGNMGAVVLAAAAARLERAAQARDDVGVEAAMLELPDLARRTVAALRAGRYA